MLVDFLVRGLGLRNSIENPAIPLTDERVLEYIRGGAGTSESGIPITEKKVMGVPPIWRGVNLLTSDLAKIPCQLLRHPPENSKGGKPTKEKTHPLYSLLTRKPGIGLKPFIWKRTLFQHALIHGNGYCLIHRAFPFGPAVAFSFLPPSPTTTPIFNEDEGELYYHTTIDGVQKLYRAYDVIHIQGLSLSDGYVGLEGASLLQVMADAFGVGLATQRHAGRYFAEGTQTVGFITSPKRFADKDLKDIKNNWPGLKAKIDEAHSVGVLYGQNVNFTPLGDDADKAQLIEARKMTAVDAANILGMPPHKLGSSEKASYNSLESENADYLQCSLDPWFINLEEELEDKLLTEDEKIAGDLYIQFNRKALLRVDYQRRIAGYKTLREIGVLNGNQICELEDLPTQGPRGDAYFVPGNWVMLDDDGSPVKPKNPSPGPPPPGQAGGDDDEADDDSEADDDQADDDQADAAEAIRRCLLESAGRILSNETARLMNAPNHPTVNASGTWLQRIYDTVQSKLIESLEPLASAFFAVGQVPHADELGKLVVKLAAHDYCRNRAMLAFHNVEASLARGETASVGYGRRAEGWEHRAEKLVERITNAKTEN